MKLYTRSGDKGDTSVIGGGRVPKDDARVEAYGTIDELNACVGLAAAWMANREESGWRELADRLTIVQHELFDCGSDLSYANPEEARMKVTPDMTGRLEKWIDELEASNPPIERFILSGGSEPSARLHLCRTVCRRAERRVVSLAAQRDCPAEVGRYLNRLSDFLFAAARTANALAGVADVEYERGAAVFRRRTPADET